MEIENVFSLYHSPLAVIYLSAISGIFEFLDLWKPMNFLSICRWVHVMEYSNEIKSLLGTSKSYITPTIEDPKALLEVTPHFL